MSKAAEREEERRRGEEEMKQEAIAKAVSGASAHVRQAHELPASLSASRVFFPLRMSMSPVASCAGRLSCDFNTCWP